MSSAVTWDILIFGINLVTIPFFIEKHTKSINKDVKNQEKFKDQKLVKDPEATAFRWKGTKVDRRIYWI